MHEVIYGMAGRLLSEPKTKTATIKREKRRGKYYVVLRENNKIIETKLWTATMSKKRPDAINTHTGKSRYKENRSIYDNRIRKTEDTWKTIFETRFVPVQSNQKAADVPKIQRARGAMYKYFVRGFFYRQKGASGVEIVASSKNHDSDYPVSSAREEAWNSFYERVSFIAHGAQKGHYDADEGMRVVESGNVKIISEGVMHYREKSRK